MLKSLLSLQEVRIGLGNILRLRITVVLSLRVLGSVLLLILWVEVGETRRILRKRIVREDGEKRMRIRVLLLLLLLLLPLGRYVERWNTNGFLDYVFNDSGVAR